MNHNKETCDLCLAGRDDLCIIRERSINNFQIATQGNGIIKDAIFSIEEKEQIEKRSAI